MLVAASLSAGCGAEARFPNEDLSGATAGGTVFVDVDGDGRPSDGDQPVAGIRVEPLTGKTLPTGDTAIFGPDPNTESTVSGADGSFSLNHRVLPQVAGIKLSIDVPVAGDQAIGGLNRIERLELGSLTNAIALPALPRDCTERSDCGAPQLPDLTPITNWDQLDAATRDRLRPADDVPPIERLLPSDTWFVETFEDGTRRLRFSSVTANVGAGPLDVIADRSPSADATATSTWQRIWTVDWDYTDRRSGEFVFHEGHDHMHFDAFEQYRLIDPTGQIVAESAKVSFCLRDSLRISDAPLPTVGPLGSAESCGANEQSINAGFADHYHQFLPDQWIDITGVAAGDYVVEITVDPLGLLLEADETNNVGTFSVSID